MKQLMYKFLSGIVFACGALAVLVVIGLITLKFLAGSQFDNLLYKVKEKTGLAHQAQALSEPVSVLKDFRNAPRIAIPDDFNQRYVSNTQELLETMIEANRSGDFVVMLLEGTYTLQQTMTITAENIVIQSVSGNPYDTVIRGSGMQGGMGNLIRVNKSGFKIDGVTLTDASFHLVQVAGEMNVDNVEMRNMIFQNAYQQLVKISYNNTQTPEIMSDNGIIANSIFQYTKGIAPYFYTGGVDGLGTNEWIIENNIFRDIASPAKHIAQYAVHFWINSRDNIIRNNIFINNDRAIGLGMLNKKINVEYDHQGGVIEGNFIMHTDDTDPYADTGIAIEQTTGVTIANNQVYLSGRYPRAIEYRFPQTRQNIIRNNITNKKIASRDNGTAQLQNNQINQDINDYYVELLRKSNELQIESIY